MVVIFYRITANKDTVDSNGVSWNKHQVVNEGCVLDIYTQINSSIYSGEFKDFDMEDFDIEIIEKKFTWEQVKELV